jgi:hypothetical protein
MPLMKTKHQITQEFVKCIVPKGNKRNCITPNQITATLTLASLTLAFTNSSCKSSGQLAKSQTIFKKIKKINAC